MALGDNIKILREEHHMTQQQLADKLYVSRQTVCRWETGSRCPDIIMAKKLAKEFDVSMDDLISDDDITGQETGRWFGRTPVRRRREKLLKYQAWTLKIIEMIGTLFLVISVFLRMQLEKTMPLWGTVVCVILVFAVVMVRCVISREIDRIS